MQIIGNQLQVTGTQSEDCSTELPPNQVTTPAYAPAQGFVFYVGMKVICPLLPTASGGYFAHFRDGGNGFRGRIYTTRSGAAAGHYRVGVANSASATSSAALAPTDLATNQPCTLVLRYNVGTGESRLWLDPASESSPGVEAVDDAQPITVQAFAFRQSSGIGALLVDDLKIGTAFSDVVSMQPSLRIAVASGQTELSWPATYAGYTIQNADSLAPASWSDVKDATTNSSGRCVVTLTNTTSHRFFRLVK